jgi:DNA-binding CsgD family transcriptional regulator
MPAAPLSPVLLSRPVSPVRGRPLRPSLAALLDRLGEAIAVYAPDGGVVHENRAYRELLLDAVLARPLREGARALAVCQRGGRPAKSAIVELGNRCLALECHLLAPDTLWPAQAVMIRVHQPASRLDSLAAATPGRRLTPRELEVARLVAEGARTRAIAVRLGLSPHTVRRHTEAILRKLGIGSRAGVGLALFGRPAILT